MFILLFYSNLSSVVSLSILASSNDSKTFIIWLSGKSSSRTRMASLFPRQLHTVRSALERQQQTV